MKKKMLENEESDENEVDEPSEVEDLQNNGTDDDWSPAPESGKRKSAGRAAKATKRTYDEEESSEESGSEEGGGGGGRSGGKKRGGGGGGTPGRGRGRGGGRGRGAKAGGGAKKPKTDEEEEPGDTSSESDSGDTPAEYKSGAYVVLKSDFKAGGEHPVWKIDGKSLLQKYIFEKDDNGDPSYKSTTIYAGWSKTSKESYYPIKVETKQQKGKDHIITFDRSQIKADDEN